MPVKYRQTFTHTLYTVFTVSIVTATFLTFGIPKVVEERTIILLVRPS